MKKYNQFIVENSRNDFRFAINVKDISDSQKEQLINKLKKYNLCYNDENIIRYELTDRHIHMIVVDVFNNYENIKQIFIMIVSTPDWGKGEIYIDYALSVDEFLSSELEDIKDNIDAKTNAKKYNL